MAVGRLALASSLLLLARLQSTSAQNNKRAIQFSAAELPAGSDGLIVVQPGEEELDTVDRSRWQRNPGLVGTAPFSTPEYIDTLELNLFFPVQSQERVTVKEVPDAVLLGDAVANALVSGDRCKVQSVTIAAPLHVCAIGRDWFNVTWAVQLQTCTKKATVELSGERSPRCLHALNVASKGTVIGSCQFGLTCSAHVEWGDCVIWVARGLKLWKFWPIWSAFACRSGVAHAVVYPFAHITI
jgi:hypothetical protein